MADCEKCDLELKTSICDDEVTCEKCGTVYTLDWELVDVDEMSYSCWVTGEVEGGTGESMFPPFDVDKALAR